MAFLRVLESIVKLLWCSMSHSGILAVTYKAQETAISLVLVKFVCIGGSVVECSPATRAARVRFPADARLYFGCFREFNLCCVVWLATRNRDERDRTLRTLYNTIGREQWATISSFLARQNLIRAAAPGPCLMTQTELLILLFCCHFNIKIADEDGIRTHAGRAQWISSPSP